MTRRAAISPVAPHEPDRVPVLIVLAGLMIILMALLATHLAALVFVPHPDANPLGGVEPAQYPAARDWPGAYDELTRLRARERANLEADEWLDEAHTVKRIPIERAMDALARPERAP